MTNIRYVCLSDLHLGEEDSLLTDPQDCTRPSPVLERLAECLAEVLRHNDPGAPRPTLILAGDVLELALCRVEQALAAFEQFLRCMMPSNSELFGDIVYIPGNHDHHVWLAAREEQYLKHLGRQAPGEPLDAPWDTTKVVMDLAGKDRLVNGVATAVARRLRHLRDRGFEILTAYPNFGVQDAGGRTVVFHHGHFIERPYRLLSELASLFFPPQDPPEDVYTLEQENASWIDFFWSTLGDRGRVGAGAESIFEATTDERSLQRITDTLAGSIASTYPVPKWAPRFVREWTLKAVLREAASRTFSGLERRQTEGDTALSGEAREGLRWYVGTLLARQFKDEGVSAPQTLSFVLGHTHKPFVELLAGTRILNTGGWVVDAPRLQPLHGAAAVLVGEDLSAVSIRWYNEGRYTAGVEEPLPEESVFCGEVRSLLQEHAQPWKAFGETVTREVDLRIASFAKRLEERAAVSQRG